MKFKFKLIKFHEPCTGSYEPKEVQVSSLYVDNCYIEIGEFSFPIVAGGKPYQSKGEPVRFSLRSKVGVHNFWLCTFTTGLHSERFLSEHETKEILRFLGAE